VDIVIFIYLIGSLLGVGLAATLINVGYNKDSGISNSQMIFYGAVLSWLNVIVFLCGALKGLVWGGKDED
jgi:hypothetical protein